MHVHVIKKLLGSVIYQRAVDYLNSGAVVDLKFHHNGDVTAMVEGSHHNVYTVRVNVDDGRYQCDCPYDDYCKHIGAVLLAMNTVGSDNAKQARVSDDTFIKAMESASREIESREERVIPITADGSGRSCRDPFIVTPVSGSSEKRYRLVFLIEDDHFYGAHIKPALQYIKQNGDTGRVEKFDAAKITEPVAQNAQRLFTTLMNGDHHPLGPYNILQTHLPLIARAGDLPLLLRQGYDTVAVRPMPISSIRISFLLNGFYGKDPIFSPLCEFRGAEGAVMGKGKLKDFKHHGSGGYFIDHSGILFYLIDEPYAVAALGMLGKSGLNITAGDIEHAAKFCAEHCGGRVEVEFHKKRVRLTHLKPECLIELDESRQGIDIFVFFNYGGSEISFRNAGEIIVRQEAGDEEEIAAIARGTDFEIAVVSRLASFLRTDRLVQSESSLMRDPFAEKLPVYRATMGMGEFLQRHGVRLMEAGYIVRMKRSGRIVKKGSGSVRYKVKSGIDWFEVEARYREGDHGEEEGLIIDEATLRHGIARAGDSYVVLSKEDMEGLARLSAGGMGGDGLMKIHAMDLAAISEIADRCAGEASDRVRELGTIHEKLKSFTAIDSCPPPESFNAALRPYQKAGYDWLNFLDQYGLNGCLADDMGLGKTVQALALLQRLKETKALGLSLLIVPVSVIPNWMSEIDRFAPGLAAVAHIGTGRVSALEEMGPVDLIITSYHTLQRDAALFIPREFHYLILDEAQSIKNAGTQSFKAVTSLRARRRLSLTGTPVENSTLELWAQMDFLNPGLLGSRREFTRRFAGPIEKQGDAAAAEALRRKVFPFILRRKKEEVARDLPPREEIDLYVEMTEKQRAVYEKHREMYRGKIGDTLQSKSVQESALAILEALLRLRQICLFPELADPRYRAAGSGKFDMLKDMIDEICREDHKVLVFSQFVQALEIVKSHVQGAGYQFAYIDGSTKKRDREIQRFQDEREVRLFLISLKAGGLGINLTAADYVIVFDPWWNPAVEAQAVDRAHRIGQTRKVIAYRLLTKSSVEEKIRELQEKKKKLVRDVVSDESSFFKSLGRDDVMALFD